LNKGLNLRIGPEFAGAHLQNCLGICPLCRRLLIQSAALLTLRPEMLKMFWMNKKEQWAQAETIKS